MKTRFITLLLALAAAGCSTTAGSQGRAEDGPITLVHSDTGAQAVCASPKSSQEATALMRGLPTPLVYTASMSLLAELNTRRISLVEYCANRYELANYVRSSTPLEPTKGATYTDTTFRWSVTHPDFWRLDSSEPRAVTLKRGMAVVGIYSKAIDGESLDEVADAALRRWEQNFKKEIEVISRRRVTLSNSLPAIEVVHHLGKSVVGKSRKIYVVVKNRAFYIDAETYLEAWPMFESDFNRIVESFVVRD